jgi:hypothetical protein
LLPLRAQFAKSRGIHAQPALESAPKGIRVLETDCDRHILDAVARQKQPAPRFIKPKRFYKVCRRPMEKSFEEAAEMPGAYAGSFRKHIDRKIVV